MKLETDAERFRRQMRSFGENDRWDEDTKRLVHMTRAFLNRQPPPTISQLQYGSMKSRPFSGESQYQICNEEVPVPPQDDMRKLFIEAIRGIKNVEFHEPKLVPVQLEWISQRVDRNMTSSLPAGRDLVMLHFHGGGHFQSDPKSYRPLNAQLASLTRGKVASVRFRLAPQHPFPAPLLDAFLAYLSLIYGSSTSSSKTTRSSKIVLIGDSSGAALIYGLLQIIDYINSHTTRCLFHNHEIRFPIPYPAGSAVLSPAGEQLQALPSQKRNSVNDLYPPEIPWISRTYPTCDLWPTTPPRLILSCETDALRSPLNTPALAHEWQGFPPMWIGVGEEKWYDSAKVIARRAALSGVQVTWFEYEAMPHCFPIVPGFSKMQQTSHLIRKWAQFCIDCVEGRLKSRTEQVRASSVSFRTLEENLIPLVQGSDPPLEAIDDMIETNRCDEARVWVGANVDDADSKL